MKVKLDAAPGGTACKHIVVTRADNGKFLAVVTIDEIREGRPDVLAEIRWNVLVALRRLIADLVRDGVLTAQSTLAQVKAAIESREVD